MKNDLIQILGGDKNWRISIFTPNSLAASFSNFGLQTGLSATANGASRARCVPRWFLKYGDLNLLSDDGKAHPQSRINGRDTQSTAERMTRELFRDRMVTGQMLGRKHACRAKNRLALTIMAVAAAGKLKETAYG